MKSELMGSKRIFDAPIKELVSAIEEEIISLDDLRDYVISQNDRYKQYRCFASFSEDLIKSQYRDLSEGKKQLVAPTVLYGIPIGVKDIINTTDYPTQMGSPIWKGFEPGNDARVVYSIRSHGGIVAGKTVTAEFAVHKLNETLNPWDITRTPGTSSSGSAASVSLGILPAALATQTAGSIIRPASFCGVYGYVPSFGLIPRTGVLKTTDSLDRIGYVTSNVHNLKTLLQSTRVRGMDYPFVFSAFMDHNRQSRGEKGYRIAFVKTYIWNEAEEYVRESVVKFVENISKDSNIAIDTIDIDEIINGAHRIHEIIYDKSLSYYFENEYRDSDNMSAVMKEMVIKGKSIGREEYLNALNMQEDMIKKMDSLFDDYDAILSISTSSIAPIRDEKEIDDPSLIWTLLHLPAVSIPQFVEEKTHLPFGVQLASRRYNDGILLELCEYLAQKSYIPEVISHPAID